LVVKKAAAAWSNKTCGISSEEFNVLNSTTDCIQSDTGPARPARQKNKRHEGLEIAEQCSLGMAASKP
jgi:hypothetical protein